MKQELIGKKVSDIRIGFDSIDIIFEDGKALAIDIDYENFSFEAVVLQKITQQYKEVGEL
jgi:hypothetical protein